MPLGDQTMTPPASRWRRFKQRGREVLDYRRREWTAYASCYTKTAPVDQARVVIFAQGRTGSTLLESLLASSGYFDLNGELLNTSQGEALSPARFIRGLARRHPGNFIFHVKVYQLTRDRKHPVDPSRFLRTLHDEGWKIIHLRRENKIKHALSNIVAETRGRYHKQDDDQERIKLTIDLDDFVRAVNERIAFESHERQVLANLPYHQVCYETDLEPPAAQQATCDAIFDFLGLEPRQVSTPHRKVNTTPLPELIANYDEVIRRAKEHNWDHFLD